MENEVLSVDNQVMAEQAKKLKELADAVYKAKQAADEYEKKYKELKGELLNIMESAEIEKVQADNCTISLQLKSSVTVPKSNEQKKQLFNYIKEEHGQEVLDSLLTINARSFSSWFTKEQEAKMQAGDFDWTVADIKPYEYYSLGIRKRSK